MILRQNRITYRWLAWAALLTFTFESLVCMKPSYSAVPQTRSKAAKQSGQQMKTFPPGYFERLRHAWTLVPSSLVKRQAAGGAGVNLSGVEANRFPLITSFVGVYDSSGKFVEGLTADRFTVFERNKGGALVSVRPQVSSVSGSQADIVFCLDTTGSMEDEIDAVKSSLQAYANRLAAAGIEFRLALITFGDEVPYRERFGFTTNIEEFKTWVAAQGADGGADTPENSLGSLISATRLPFNPGAQRVVILITDAPPHIAGDGGDSSTTATIADTIRALSGHNVFYWLGDPDEQPEAVQTYNLSRLTHFLQMPRE